MKFKKSEPICSTEGLSNDYNGTKVIDWFVVYLAKTKSFLVYRKRKMKVGGKNIRVREGNKSVGN